MVQKIVTLASESVKFSAGLNGSPLHEFLGRPNTAVEKRKSEHGEEEKCDEVDDSLAEALVKSYTELELPALDFKRRDNFAAVEQYPSLKDLILDFE